MGTLSSDLRSAARMLAGRPGFTAVAILTLALGIGANTAIFSVVHAILLRPLPYQDADRLVRASSVIPEAAFELTAAADYLDWRDQSQLLSSVAAFDTTRLTLQGDEQPERIRVGRVSTSFLPTLGVHLKQGRNFLPQEERLGGGPAAIVTQRFWQRRFGRDAALDSQMLRLDNKVYPIVGVLPSGFLFPRDAEVEILVPLTLDETVERARQQMTIVDVIGRLRPGVATTRAMAELDGIRKRAEAVAREAAAREAPAPPQEGTAPGPGGPPQAGPGGPGGGPGGGRMMRIAVGGPDGPGGPPGGGSGGPRRGGPGGGPGGGGPMGMPETVLKVIPVREWLVGDVRLELLLLLGAVGCVLLIACANVANLLLARATARRQEIAIRAALGADRWRITRLLLTESTLLGVLGGACGLLLALVGIRPLVARIPSELGAGVFRQTEIGLDASVLLFTLGLSVATGLLFGLAPALAASRRDLQDPLKEGQRSGGRSGIARGLLVAAEVAVAAVLLIGAGLLLRSFLRLQAVDPGFDPEGVLTLRLDLDPQRYSSPGSRAAFFQELARRVRGVPGVESVSYSDSLPLLGFSMIIRGMNAEGRPPFEPGQAPEIGVAAVGPDYFRTMGIRLLRGRAFQESDTEGGQPVAIVSEGMALRLWGSEDPLGRRLTGGPGGGAVVIGLVPDVKQDGLETTSQRLQMYRPYLQQPLPFGTLEVRTQGDPAALTSMVRREILALDLNVPVFDVSTMEDRLASSVAGRRFNLTLLGLFALLALVLAGIGLYGVLSYAVTERTHEIGIRMALGAQREGVLGLILRQGLTLAAVGAGAGLVLAFLSGRLLRSSLYGVTAADPVTFALIPLLLMAVATLSSWLPAWRATRVDPMIALRNEV